ncbi:MAG: STAS/SEC14 domain-containing protein [Bacteroidia bacterium]
MQKIRTKINEKWVDENGVLHMKVLDGAEIDLPSLIDDAAVNSTLTGGKKALALYDARNFFTITDEASEYLKSGILDETRIATAVVTDKLAARLFVNFMQLVKKPKTPLKMFSNEESALGWLQTFKN